MTDELEYEFRHCHRCGYETEHHRVRGRRLVSGLYSALSAWTCCNARTHSEPQQVANRAEPTA